jgi:hypothetical protein
MALYNMGGAIVPERGGIGGKDNGGKPSSLLFSIKVAKSCISQADWQATMEQQVHRSLWVPYSVP